MPKGIRQCFKRPRWLRRKHRNDAVKSPVYPDWGEFERTAESQRQSPFFSLPPEIGQHIILAAWEMAGHSQHVYTTSMGKLFHSACVTDNDESDTRWAAETLLEDIRREELYLWLRRQGSRWHNHWKCDDYANAAKDHAQLTPFLPLLLTCKRMYLQARDSLYKAVTFHFHQAETAFALLRNERFANSITRLQLSLKLDVEFWPEELWINESIKSWLALRDRLAELKNLRSVNVWLDTGNPYSRNEMWRPSVLFDFHERLRPVLVLSLPVQVDDDIEPASVKFDRSGLSVVQREYSNSWMSVYPHRPPRPTGLEPQKGCKMGIHYF